MQISAEVKDLIVDMGRQCEYRLARAALCAADGLEAAVFWQDAAERASALAFEFAEPFAC